jgi:5-methylcytosine-specific restriction endonuclease McrA
MILARDPLCKIAVLCDGTAPSVEADHIVPLNAGGDWSLENGQGGCKACHSYKTAKIDSDFARRGKRT